MKEYNKIWEAQLQENLLNKTIAQQLTSFEETEYTFWQKVAMKLRTIKSYLTRYQIVDTWTVHDNCD